MVKNAMKFSYHRITQPWQPLTLEVIEAEILDRDHAQVLPTLFGWEPTIYWLAPTRSSNYVV